MPPKKYEIPETPTRRNPRRESKPTEYMNPNPASPSPTPPAAIQLATPPRRNRTQRSRHANPPTDAPVSLPANPPVNLLPAHLQASPPSQDVSRQKQRAQTEPLPDRPRWPQRLTNSFPPGRPPFLQPHRTVRELLIEHKQGLGNLIWGFCLFIVLAYYFDTDGDVPIFWLPWCRLGWLWGGIWSACVPNPVLTWHTPPPDYLPAIHGLQVLLLEASMFGWWLERFSIAWDYEEKAAHFNQGLQALHSRKEMLGVRPRLYVTPRRYIAHEVDRFFLDVGHLGNKLKKMEPQVLQIALDTQNELKKITEEEHRSGLIGLGKDLLGFGQAQRERESAALIYQRAELYEGFMTWGLENATEMLERATELGVLLSGTNVFLAELQDDVKQSHAASGPPKDERGFGIHQGSRRSQTWDLIPHSKPPRRSYWDAFGLPWSSGDPRRHLYAAARLEGLLDKNATDEDVWLVQEALQGFVNHVAAGQKIASDVARNLAPLANGLRVGRFGKGPLATYPDTHQAARRDVEKLHQRRKELMKRYEGAKEGMMLRGGNAQRTVGRDGWSRMVPAGTLSYRGKRDVCLESWKVYHVYHELCERDVSADSHEDTTSGGLTNEDSRDRSDVEDPGAEVSSAMTTVGGKQSTSDSQKKTSNSMQGRKTATTTEPWAQATSRPDPRYLILGETYQVELVGVVDVVIETA